MPQRADALYGRGRIADFVHQSLERHGVPDRIVPIVLLLGRRGTGKTALLDLLHERYRDVRPYVRIDLSDDPNVDALRMLVAVKSGLGRKVPRVKPISFPRFEFGLLALGLDPTDSERIRQAQIDAMLKGHGLAQQIDRFQQDWAQRLDPLLSSHERQLALMLASNVLSWSLSQVGNRDRGRTAAWYDAYAAQAGGPGSNPLANLCTWDESEITTALCAALLTDLRTGFNRHGDWGRTTNCLVALDNVDTEAGMAFLEALARCRRLAPADEGPDPLVVVAARSRQPGAELAVGAPLDATSEKLRFGNWLADSRKPAPQWYPIALTDLGVAEVAAMAGSNVLGSHGRDAEFVHALACGHPEASRLLAEALAENGSARNLLSGKLRDDLITALLPQDIDDAMLDALTVCVATPGMDHGACDSVFRYLSWHSDVITVRAVRDFGRETLWATETGERNLTPHPLLRTLLLHRLADQPDRWREVHEQFAAHYARASDGAAARYHSLALVTSGQKTQFAAVATHLESDFARLRADPWHTELRRISAAPNRLRTTADPRVTVTELAGVPDESNRSRVIARLLAALWLHHDRLFDPQRQLARVVRDEYTHLGALAGEHGAEFYTASEDY